MRAANGAPCGRISTAPELPSSLWLQRHHPIQTGGGEEDPSGQDGRGRTHPDAPDLAQGGPALPRRLDLIAADRTAIAHQHPDRAAVGVRPDDRLRQDRTMIGRVERLHLASQMARSPLATQVLSVQQAQDPLFARLNSEGGSSAGRNGGQQGRSSTPQVLILVRHPSNRGWGIGVEEMGPVWRQLEDAIPPVATILIGGIRAVASGDEEVPGQRVNHGARPRPYPAIVLPALAGGQEMLAIGAQAVEDVRGALCEINDHQMTLVRWRIPSESGRRDIEIPIGGIQRGGFFLARLHGGNRDWPALASDFPTRDGLVLMHLPIHAVAIHHGPSRIPNGRGGGHFVGVRRGEGRLCPELPSGAGIERHQAADFGGQIEHIVGCPIGPGQVWEQNGSRIGHLRQAVYPEAVQSCHGGRGDGGFLRVDATAGRINVKGEPGATTRAATCLSRLGQQRAWAARERFVALMADERNQDKDEPDEERAEGDPRYAPSLPGSFHHAADVSFADPSSGNISPGFESLSGKLWRASNARS